MKGLVAVVVVMAALVAGAVALATANLRALIGVHHDRLVARVTEAVGRPVTVGEIVPSWWPLGIRLRDVAIGEDAAFGTTPFLRADGVVMGVRPWPLVQGRIEASGVTLDRPYVHLVRGADGRWNVESLGTAPERDGPGGGAPKPKDRFSFRVPLEWVVGVALSDMRAGTLVIEDRRADPAILLELRHVRVHAEDVRFGATARVRVQAALFAAHAPDTRVDLQVPALGQNDAEHSPFTAHVEVDDVDLAAVAAWLGGPRRAAGKVRRVAVDVEGTLERARTTVELAAADPALVIGAVPLGRVQPLSASAVVTHTRAALTIEQLRATLGDLVLQAEGEATVDPPRAALTFASDPDGSAVLPIGGADVAVRGVEGSVTVERDGARVDPLVLRLGDVPLEIRGWVTGTAPPAFDLRVEGRPFGGTLAADVVVDAGGSARARVEADAIDLAPAVARFVPQLEGAVAGKGSGAAVLSGRVADGALLTDALAGNGTLMVQDGRLRAVNLPDLVIDQIEKVPLMPTIVSASTRARYAELFASPDTVVESATIPFTVQRGRLATERAVLVNPAYQVTGDGWIDAAKGLRFRGTVLLGASVSRALRDDVPAVKYLAGDDGRIALPFVARGPLGDVRVEPDGKRLRTRGLEALLGAEPAAGTAAGQRERKRDDRTDDEDIEERVIERLEKLLGR